MYVCVLIVVIEGLFVASANFVSVIGIKINS